MVMDHGSSYNIIPILYYHRRALHLRPLLYFPFPLHHFYHVLFNPPNVPQHMLKYNRRSLRIQIDVLLLSKACPDRFLEGLNIVSIASSSFDHQFTELRRRPLFFLYTQSKNIMVDAYTFSMPYAPVSVVEPLAKFVAYSAYHT